MKYLISLFEWGEQRELSSELALRINDVVVIDLGFGKHLGTVSAIKNSGDSQESGAGEIINEGKILRKATALEKDKIGLNQEKSDEFLRKCRELVKKYDLPMKLVGVDLSIEGGGIIFGFTAEERID